MAPFLHYQNLGLAPANHCRRWHAGHRQGRPQYHRRGLVVGHQWLYRQRVALDTFIGPSYNSNLMKIKASSGDASASFDVGSFQGFSLRTGITLGVAF